MPNTNSHTKLINRMRTIYSPYKSENNPSDPSSSLRVEKARESLSSQTLGTCPTWTSTDDSLQLDESNNENLDPVAPKSTTKERKRWIENALLTKKDYTPFNTPAREEYCRNKSNRDLTSERKQWIEATLLNKEQKTYNTKIREEYCKNKDNHELTNERKRWIEETLLTKTNTLPPTPSNKKLKFDDAEVKESASCEIVQEALPPIADSKRQFTGPSEIDGELMQKLHQRKLAEDEAGMNPAAAAEDTRRMANKEDAKPVKIDAELRKKLQQRKQAEENPHASEEEARQRHNEEERQRQLMAQEEARQLKLMEEEEARQRQLMAEEKARQRQLMEVEEARRLEQDRVDKEARLAEKAQRERQVIEEEDARQRQLVEKEARRMEQERIMEEAKLADEAIAALQRRLDEERLKREQLEEEARLAKEARDEEHKRFVELEQNAKLFESRIGELEKQQQQRNKMRAYITTLKDEKKLRADELAIVEELEKDIESEDEAEEEEEEEEENVAIAEYNAYLRNYDSMSEHISTMGSNNIFALTNTCDEKDVSSQRSDLSGTSCLKEGERTHTGVQSNMPRRTPMVIRSVGSFTDLEERKQATSAKKHRKRMKLLEKLVKLLSRSKKHEC